MKLECALKATLRQGQFARQHLRAFGRNGSFRYYRDVGGVVAAEIAHEMERPGLTNAGKSAFAGDAAI